MKNRRNAVRRAYGGGGGVVVAKQRFVSGE